MNTPLDVLDSRDLLSQAESRFSHRLVDDGSGRRSLAREILTDAVEIEVRQDIDCIPLVAQGSACLGGCGDEHSGNCRRECRSGEVHFSLRLTRVVYDRRGISARLIYDVEQQ